MNPRELTDLVDQVELKNPPFPIRLSSRSEDDYVVVMFEMDVTHRETGEPFTSTGEMMLFSGINRAKAILRLFEFIELNFKHEAVECFHVNGERVFDPHKE